MVITYSLLAGTLTRKAEHASMAAASAALPEGAYTTFRTYDHNRLLRLGQHLRRLEESLGLMRNAVAAHIDDDAVRAAIAQVLQATGYAESRCRLTYADPALFITVEPFEPYPHDLYETGVWCVTVQAHRDNPHAKNTAFITSAGAAMKTMPAGAHEGLMLAADGSILEGLSSNFFAITSIASAFEDADDQVPVLRTEEARVLIGVTRSLVLEQAQHLLPVSTVAVRVADLPRITECFITSVSREILPVVKIDQQVIGECAPGPITRELMRRFRDMVALEAQPAASASQ